MLNLRFFSSVGAASLSLALLFGGSLPAHAATVNPGTLIKASGPAVYYVSQSGTRYAFPDSATYASWYRDFSSVQSVSDTDLSQIPFGGVVTVRPGARLVKIQTDPRVYAVGRGGTLHWIQTETVARALYGDAWNRQVNDVPDAFFTNYRIQTDIVQSSDFNPMTEQSLAGTIDLDLQARTAPTPPLATTPATTTPVVVPPPVTTPTSTTPLLTGRIDILSTGPYIAGDTVTVLASLTHGYADRISLSFGTGAQPSRCANNPCRAEFVIPNVQTTTTIPLQAIFTAGEGTNIITGTTTQEITALPNPTSDAILVLTPVQGIYGGGRRIRVEVAPTMSARNIKIVVDDLVKQECFSTQGCEYSEQETQRGGTHHSVYAIVIDGDFHRWFSPVSTFPVVE